MDKTLEILINNANIILHEKITIIKDQTTINKRSYKLTKGNISIPCRDKTQLIKDILSEVYNQGKESKLKEFTRLLGI